MDPVTSKNFAGLEVISQEANTVTNASEAIFANAPEGTDMILLTIRGGGITMVFNKLDGNIVDATAGAVGHDYAANDEREPYEFYMTLSDALRVRAIRTGADDALCYITYFHKR